MGKTLVAFGLGLLAVAPAGAQDLERIAMANLRLTTEPSTVQGCARIGVVRDDSLRDLRRKIVRAGGNVAVLSFLVDNLSTMDAEVFSCPTAGQPAPAAGPPPPPGAPRPPSR
ncbi:MAG: hypothetical protein L0027_05590 [Candidatus Rokubacteria bacterium]|nr:hypothetical protein [Candidatus Rokubacteria bacterium]